MGILLVIAKKHRLKKTLYLNVILSRLELKMPTNNIAFPIKLDFDVGNKPGVNYDQAYFERYMRN